MPEINKGILMAIKYASSSALAPYVLAMTNWFTKLTKPQTSDKKVTTMEERKTDIHELSHA